MDDAIAAAVAGVRGRARDDTPTTVNVRLWKHLAINDYGVEQQLFKAYIRSLRFEGLRVNARDATYARIQYEDGGNVVAGFARINYFFVYGDSRKSHMLANLDIIDTTSVDVQRVPVVEPVQGGEAPVPVPVAGWQNLGLSLRQCSPR